MGTYGDLWGPLLTYGDPCGPMGTFGDLWGPLGTSRKLWGPMGAYGDLLGPMGSFGDLWGLTGTYGDVWGPMGTFSGFWFFLAFSCWLDHFPTPLFLFFFLAGFLHTHFDPYPPRPPSMKPTSDILLYTLQTQHATSDIRHQTLYTILRGTGVHDANAKMVPIVVKNKGIGK